MNNTEISVVIPVFNEEGCLPGLFRRLIAVMEDTGKSFELIFVNDGSTDRSGELLQRFHEEYPGNVTLIEFNGNFGQYTAICAGFEKVRGRVAVTLDADLQNPPEEIPKLLRKMEEGYDFVGGIRCDRQDSLHRKWSSRIINILREKTTGIKVTDQGCMLRAYSYSIVKAVCGSNEKSVFISALAYKYATNPCEVNVAHAPRNSGKSRYNYFGLIKLNFDLLTGFTLVPLQAMTLFGIGLTGLSFCGLVFMGFSLLFFHTGLSPLFLLVSGLGFLVGVQLTGLGLIGEYVGRIYQTVLGRPNYIIKRVVEAEMDNAVPVRHYQQSDKLTLV